MRKGVVHVSESDAWSGGAAQLLGLAGGLRERGWRTWIAARPDSGLSRTALERDLDVFHLPIRQDYDIVSGWRLARFIAAKKIGIIHAHHSRSHGVGLLAKLLCPRPKPLLVVSRRVSFAVGKNPFSLWKYRSGLIDSYVAVAEAVKDVIVSCGVGPERVAVIHSGVDARTFSRRPPSSAVLRELKIPDGAALVGKIANASPWKGQTTFLEAAAILACKRRSLHFLLAGRDTDGDWLRGEVSRLGLDGRVSLAGFRTDIPEILPCLALSVNAATRGEGLSGALRESLCMGVPVVASDIAGNRELLGDAGRGFLFPPGDARALADRIEWALDHPEEARAAVEAWEKRLESDFSLEQTIAKTEALYLKISPTNA